MKRLIALLMMVLVLMVGTAIAEDASVEYITEKGTFILGLDDSFPPMGFRDENNEIVGFDIDTAREVCKRLGVELVLQPVDWATKELELSSGNIDCVWNGMSITPDREEAMSMTFSYLNNQIMVYVQKDSGIATLEDLKGKRIAVQGGSYAEEMLAYEENLDLAESFGEVLAFDEYLTALMDLQQGGVDAVIIDRVVADYRIGGMGATDLVPVIAMSDDNYGIGFRKADVALCEKVESILIEMKNDGTLATISEKWFGSDISVVPTK